MRSFVLLALLTCTAFGQSIHLKTRTIDTSRQPRPFARSVEPGNGVASHRIVQFDHPPAAGDLASLVEEGMQLVAALPDNAVMVMAPAGIVPAANGIRWVGSLLPSDKLSPDLGLTAIRDDDTVTAIVEFHADTARAAQDEIAAAEHLTFLRPAILAGNHALVTASASQFRQLAGHDEVDYIFPADPSLATSPSNTLLCAGMLTMSGTVAQYSNLVQGWDLDTDGVAHLGYIFGPVTPKVPALTVKSEIVRALNTWAAQTNLTFEQKVNPSAARTVMVKYVSGAHGDPYPFDGPGGVLAHTFYPPPMNPESVAGDIHMDADENWHAGGDVDIYSVALHESGHALGLGHSDKPNDVMYPYYRSHLPLSANDIGEIRALYGELPGTGGGGSSSSGSGSGSDSGSGSGSGSTGGSGSSGTPAPPALTIRQPAAVSTATKISITGAITGGTPNYTVEWQTDRGFSGNALVSAKSWTAQDITLASGLNTITFTVLDAMQKSSSAAVSVSMVTPQTQQGGQAPVSISVNTPASVVSTVNTSTLTVTGRASSGAGLMQVTWQTSNGADGTAEGTDHWLAQDIPLLVGTNVIILKAWDINGLISRRALVVIRR